MKPLVSLLALCFVAAGLSGQTQYQKVLGTTSNDRPYQLVVLADGSIISTGYTQSTTGNGNESFLMKTDPLGYMHWMKAYGGPQDETTWDVSLTANNEIVGVGVSGSLGTPHSGATIVRADTAGTVIWATGVSHLNGAVDFYRVMETTTGELVATGLVQTTNQQDDILLCKFSSTGNLLWSKSIGSTENDEIMGLTETPQGHYLLAGLTRDQGGSGGSDFAAVKTDTAGNVIWKQRYGGSSGDRLNDVVAVGNEYYFCGWSSSAGQGKDDVVLMKTDSTGQLLWAESYGTVEHERVFNMLFNSRDSSLVLAGYTEFAGVGPSNRNALLMKAGLDGTLQWARSYGSSGTDGHWPTGLSRGPDTGYYLLSMTNSFSSAGQDDLYLIKTNEVGQAGCHQTNPQLAQGSVTGWSGSNFGTSANAGVMSASIPVSGTGLTASSSAECCVLYDDIGPDTAGCVGDSVTLGPLPLPGYDYHWQTFPGGTPISSQSQIRVAVADSGTYLFGVSAKGGLDCLASGDTVTVTVYPQPDKPGIYDMGGFLTTDSAHAYQWFFQGDSIPGAVQITHTPIAFGAYQVMVVNEWGCHAMSDSLYFTDLEEWAASNPVSVYPNPARDRVWVEFETGVREVSLQLFDPAGREVQQRVLTEVIAGHREALDISDLPRSMYLLRMALPQGVQWVKISRKP